MKKYLALAFCAALPCSVVRAAEGTAKTFPAAGLKSIRVLTETGDIEVQAVDGPDARVSVAGLDPEKCVLTMETRGESLVLEARKVSKWFRRSNDCRAGFEVQVPARLAAKVVSGTGRIAAAGLEGALDFKDGAGDVRLSGAAGEVRVKAGSGSVEGDVQGDVRTGRISVLAGSGEVKLRWTRAPEEGDVKVASGSGDVALAFPAEAKMRARVVSGAGKVFNEIGETSDARLIVLATSGAGDVSIRKAAAPARN